MYFWSQWSESSSSGLKSVSFKRILILYTVQTIIFPTHMPWETWYISAGNADQRSFVGVSIPWQVQSIIFQTHRPWETWYSRAGDAGQRSFVEVSIPWQVLYTLQQSIYVRVLSPRLLIIFLATVKKNLNKVIIAFEEWNDETSKSTKLVSLYYTFEASERTNFFLCMQYIFSDGTLDMGKLKELVQTVGQNRVVVDLSCRRKVSLI